jgi:uncharacterized protein (UPF0332 family)
MADRDLVRGELEQAEQALADATGALDANLSDAVVVNRLYYACFHAAQAVLYDRGYEPESHGGVLSLFGSEIVAAGDASRDQGRLLNDLSALRKQADYGYESIDEDLESLVDRVETFVADAKGLLEERS